MRLHVHVPLWLYIGSAMLGGCGSLVVRFARAMARSARTARLLLAALCFLLAEGCDRMQKRQDRRRAQRGR